MKRDKEQGHVSITWSQIMVVENSKNFINMTFRKREVDTRTKHSGNSHYRITKDEAEKKCALHALATGPFGGHWLSTSSSMNKTCGSIPQEVGGMKGHLCT
jgi:hypothetical protein